MCLEPRKFVLQLLAAFGKWFVPTPKIVRRQFVGEIKLINALVFGLDFLEFDFCGRNEPFPFADCFVCGFDVPGDIGRREQKF